MVKEYHQVVSDAKYNLKLMEGDYKSDKELLKHLTDELKYLRERHRGTAGFRELKRSYLKEKIKEYKFMKFLVQLRNMKPEKIRKELEKLDIKIKAKKLHTGYDGYRYHYLSKRYCKFHPTSKYCKRLN